MTDPVDSRFKSQPSIFSFPDSGMGSSPDSGDFKPSWTRNPFKLGGSGTDEKPAKPDLKVGTGPRPGGLDDAPVTPPGPEAAKKPVAAKAAVPPISTPVVIAAAKLAFKRDILGHKTRLFTSPTFAILAGVLGFVGNLTGPKKED
ncbi:hypothetical protein ACSFA3_00465 [Variovorax sp. RHLX14]|uniref:hypothetical protein n=1 Tax=Variovorax sp. RHLX14 TaxID=1259731 RepID=UPI003F453EC0